MYHIPCDLYTHFNSPFSATCLMLFLSRAHLALIWNMEVRVLFYCLGPIFTDISHGYAEMELKKSIFSLISKQICTLNCYRLDTSEQIWSCRQFAVTNFRRDEWVWMSLLLFWKQVTHKLRKICCIFFFNMGNLAKLKTNLQNPKRPCII